MRNPSREPEHRRSTALAADGPRVRAAGKFLYEEGRKLYLKGVTYGSFRPGARDEPFPEPERVEADFAAMAEAGVNTVRTYDAPPRWLLDLAAEAGLRVMAGLPWEQHVTFQDDRRRARDIESRVRQAVRGCGEHPAVLAYAVGNEIPSPIVRWHGRKRIERFLERLYEAVKESAPESLVTYVNYPTTEYLELPFLDFVSFNVFLEKRKSLEAYLARLQNLSGDRPLVLTEVGLDSRSHGEDRQAEVLDWQLRTVFASGCAGACVFSWTDEWFRGGHEIEDWDFGLVRRDRSPKPALEAVQRAFRDAPLAPDPSWPKISVAVCVYNGAATLRECLEAATDLDYPDYEVVVVDDGSTDDSAQIAAEYPVRLIRTENRGLSAARNTAWQEARGEVVAYLDSDAFPDRHWLSYLAHAFSTSSRAGIGGPNVVPPDAGLVEHCVAHAPGGPVHVLLTDTRAEHIPGCNMAFRREALAEVGGFDEQFRIAGDDVDICWRLRWCDMTLGYHPGALVWHHRRKSVRGYFKQQLFYGKAEAQLERKWPQKYSEFGHPVWRGRIYTEGHASFLGPRRWRVYHGIWGSSLFQSLYAGPGSLASALPLMPEWILLVLLLIGLTCLGLAWPPLLWAALPAGIFLAGVMAVALGSVQQARFGHRYRTSTWRRLAARTVTFCLHILQPAARLRGRLQHNLAPWTSRGVSGLAPPWPRVVSHWSEQWRSPSDWLRQLEQTLRAVRVVTRRGGAYDRWDLEAKAGPLASLRLLLATEEHGAGRQHLKIRVRPRWTRLAVVPFLLFGFLALLSAFDGAWGVSAVLGALALALAARSLYEAGTVMASVNTSVEALDRVAEDPDATGAIVPAPAETAAGKVELRAG